ncbi:unnamed protein product [Clonostachys rosea f. rosea IK726]|uniref:Uncharacterized protein n=1 Tax=Clonostachys rosea f. rosea IK726 TaxID=1349383 RepID=A0ACA9TKK6_BIOOC|nr:unnamed protein product [Clonostachys rosea f. rosea IK726]
MASKAAVPVVPIPSQMPCQADAVVETRSPPRPPRGQSSKRKQKASGLRVEDSQTKPPAIEVLDDGAFPQGTSEAKPASVRVALPSETNAPAPVNPSLDDKFPPDNMADTKPTEGAVESKQGGPEPQSHGLDDPLRKMPADSLIQTPLKQPAKAKKEKSHGRREDESSFENWQPSSQGLDGASSSRIELESSSQHPRGGPDVAPVEKQHEKQEEEPETQEKKPKKHEKKPEKQEEQPKKHEKKLERLEKQPEKQEEQLKRAEVSEPTVWNNCRIPSIFTAEEIKGRKQAWDRIPMPLKDQKTKKRNLPVSAKPTSSVPKVHAVKNKLQTPEGRNRTTEENQTPFPLPKTQPQQTEAEQSVDPEGFQLVSPRRKRIGKEKQHPQTLTIRENQRRGVEREITNFFGLLPGQQVTIEAHEHGSEQEGSPDVSSSPSTKGNDSGQAAPPSGTPPVEQSQPKSKKKKKNKKSKRNQSVSSLAVAEEPRASEKLPEETDPTHSSETLKTDSKVEDPQIPSDGNKPSETPDSSGRDTLGFKAGAPFGSGGTLKMPKKRAKRPQVTDSHWEPQKGLKIKTSAGVGQSGLGSEASSSRMATPTSETSSGLNPRATNFISPPAEKQSSDEDSDMSVMLGVFGQLAQNKRETEALMKQKENEPYRREKGGSRSSSSETIDWEETGYRRHTNNDERSHKSRSESPPHIIFTKGKQPEIKSGKGKEPMGPATEIEEEGPALKKKEQPTAPGDPGDPGDPDEPQPGLVNDSWPRLPPRELLTQDMLLNDAPAAWKRR